MQCILSENCLVNSKTAWGFLGKSTHITTYFTTLEGTWEITGKKGLQCICKKKRKKYIAMGLP